MGWRTNVPDDCKYAKIEKANRLYDRVEEDFLVISGWSDDEVVVNLPDGVDGISISRDAIGKKKSRYVPVIVLDLKD